MSRPLPHHIEQAIQEQEERLTRELREETGRGDLVVEFDRTPVWPDDFRGFGTNVKPKKQR